MPYADIFDPAVTAALLERIERLQPSARPLWGRMDAAQMLCHCCLIYEQILGERGGGPWLLRLVARALFKRTVLSDRPFQRNLPTPKAFRTVDPKEFAREQTRLRTLVGAVHGQGRAAFEGRRHVTWGALRAAEWSTLLHKHLDHHLRQFGA